MREVLGCSRGDVGQAAPVPVKHTVAEDVVQQDRQNRDPANAVELRDMRAKTWRRRAAL